MKLCPTCNRNYADDTLIFCTDDGANLSAAYDANATWQIPAARNTDPPATEVIPPQHLPGYQGSGTWPAQPQPVAAPIPPTVQAGGAPPPQYPPPAQYQSAPLVAPKKSNAPWIAASAVLAIVALSLVGVVGYMLLRSDSTAGTSGKPDINITAPNTNNSDNDNSANPANDNSSTTNTSPSNTNTGGGNDATWLEGTWSGTGTQYDGGTWTFKYVNANGGHKIDYPSVKCGGKWEPVTIKSNEAVFTERITYGKDCLSDGRVVVTKTSDGALNCKWYYIGDIIGAEATLRRE